ncbi:MAG: hypothetical protein CR982_04270 [Candidatus Cloacimonadota bacterium]|nr:MAG: hypothetical protein CR982_04270 [Candidatus Cloacimonadota bacterium]PIE78495.1 MAG: hypothetical protein CSA15_07310 [Candidatus Delongbacteria bacterium]
MDSVKNNSGDFMDKHLIEKIIEKLPVMDRVAREVISIINDENTTSTQLENTIKKDSVLTLKVLKLANSSYFSPMKPITTTAHAIRYIGFNTLKSLVYSIALQSIGSTSGKAGKEIKYLHNKSIGNGVVAMIVGRSYFRKNRKGFSPEDYYTFSLFHDIGLISLVNYDYEAYKILEKKVFEERVPIVKAEIYYDHSLIGQKLMEKWQLPESFSQMIKTHHQELDSEDKFYITSKIINIAEHLCYIKGIDGFADKNFDIVNELIDLNLDPTEFFNDNGDLNESFVGQFDELLGTLLN